MAGGPAGRARAARARGGGARRRGDGRGPAMGSPATPALWVPGFAAAALVRQDPALRGRPVAALRGATIRTVVAVTAGGGGGRGARGHERDRGRDARARSRRAHGGPRGRARRRRGAPRCRVGDLAAHRGGRAGQSLPRPRRARAALRRRAADRRAAGRGGRGGRAAGARRHRGDADPGAPGGARRRAAPGGAAGRRGGVPRPARPRPPRARAGPRARLERWGIGTLGALAALPTAALLARLGPPAVRLQALARGADAGPFVPHLEPEPCREAITLDWEVPSLPALAFVLDRLLAQLAARLALREAGAAALRLSLRLADGGVHEHRLGVAAPLRDGRTLGRLLRAELEALRLPAPVVAVAVEAEPVPLAALQADLFAPPRPSPRELGEILGRLAALVGADRVGAPVAPDTHHPDALGVAPFPGAVAEPTVGATPGGLPAGAPPWVTGAALVRRRLVPPRPARVECHAGRPAPRRGRGVPGRGRGRGGALADLGRVVEPRRRGRARSGTSPCRTASRAGSRAIARRMPGPSTRSTTEASPV